MNILNMNKRQFDYVLNREGKTIIDYYDNSKKYHVFFRRNNRSNTPQGKLRMYYSQDSDLTTGTVFTLKGQSYVIVSQDAIESDVYYTSLAVKCDATFKVEIGKLSYIVPFVVANDKYTIQTGKYITTQEGSITIYTGLNDITKNIKTGTYYENFGNAYSVVNHFFNNGLCYIYLTQSNKLKHTLVYTGDTELNMNESTTYQLTYEAKQGTKIIQDATLTYTSSDDSIATVDENGLLTMVNEDGGQVTITANWVGDDVTCQTSIDITGIVKKYILTYTGDTELDMNESTTYQLTYIAKQNDTAIENPTLTYRSSDTSIATVNTNGTVTLLKGGNVTITTTWTECSAVCQTTLNVTGISEQSGSITISGQDNLKLSYTKKYTAIFKDSNGNILTDIIPTWTITDCDFVSKIRMSQVTGEPQAITLKVTDEMCLDETFTLNVSAENFTPCQKQITIVDGL